MSKSTSSAIITINITSDVHKNKTNHKHTSARANAGACKHKCKRAPRNPRRPNPTTASPSLATASAPTVRDTAARNTKNNTVAATNGGSMSHLGARTAYTVAPRNEQAVHCVHQSAARHLPRLRPTACRAPAML